MPWCTLTLLDSLPVGSGQSKIFLIQITTGRGGGEFGDQGGEEFRGGGGTRRVAFLRHPSRLSVAPLWPRSGVAR